MQRWTLYVATTTQPPSSHVMSATAAALGIVTTSVPARNFQSGTLDAPATTATFGTERAR
jgi:hypothetical protein